MKKIQLLFLVLLPFIGRSQIAIETLPSSDAINDFFAGNGVFISNVTFNSLPSSTTTGQLGYFLADPGQFPFEQGIIMATGNVQVAVGPNDHGSATNNVGVSPDPNDPDLAAIVSPYTMNNEAVLEFDFVPAGDSIVFEYIFASEEYHEYSTSSFNDGFGFFLSGPGFSGPYTNGAENIAIIPGTSLPVTMNNVNNGSSNTGPCTNCAFLTDNPTGSQHVQYDGYTVGLIAVANVICGETYHMKLAIGDAGDTSFDSGVFLRGSSFISNGLGLTIGADQAFSFLNTEIVEGCDSMGLFISLPTWGIGTGQEVIISTGGNAILNTDYTISDTLITFGVGDTILPFFINPIIDGLVEPNDSIILNISFLTPCGDTLGVEKVIHIKDFENLSLVTTADTLMSCPSEELILETELIGNAGSNDLLSWSNGDSSFETTVYPLGDTVFTVMLSTGCVQQPFLYDTVNVGVISNLMGNIFDPGLCPGDSIVTLTYSGNADSISWSSNTLSDTLDFGNPFYELILFDTINDCELTINHQVFVHPQTFSTIYNVGGVLHSDTISTYQWYYNGVLLTGETGQTFTPTDTGYYYVIGTDENGCEVWSDTTIVTSLLNVDSNVLDSFRFYPNPAKSDITIDFGGVKSGNLIFQNVNGQIIYNQQISAKNYINVDLTSFAKGVYIIHFKDGATGVVVRKKLLLE